MINPQFFPNQRRRVELHSWRPLLNSQGEKRIRFDMFLPLSGESFVGIPQFLQESHSSMEKEDSAIGGIDFPVEFDDFTVEFRATSTSAAPLQLPGGGRLLLSHCHLAKFNLARIPEDHVSLVVLNFQLSCPSTAALAAWAHDANGDTMWGEFTYDAEPDQTSLPLPLGKIEIVNEKPVVVPGPVAAVAMVKALCSYPCCKLEDEHEGPHELQEDFVDGPPAIKQAQPNGEAQKPRRLRGFGVPKNAQVPS
jgi:hypothetical protein